MKRYLCIDIGGTSIKYAILNQEANYLEPTQEIGTPSGGEILDAVIQLVQLHIDKGLDGVAISSAGVIDPELGKVVYSGPTIQNYIGTDFKGSLESKFNIPVAVENDVNAALLGEYWKGAAQNSGSTFMVTVGTGIGGAFMIGNQLWHGATLSGGEVGYLHLKDARIQELAASSVLVRKVSEDLGYEITGRDLFRLAKEGNSISIAAIEGLVKDLCLGLSDIMYLINPETLILGGGIMQQSSYLEPLIHKALDEILVDPRFKSQRIGFAQLGNDAGLIGALYHLLHRKKV